MVRIKGFCLIIIINGQFSDPFEELYSGISYGHPSLKVKFGSVFRVKTIGLNLGLNLGSNKKAGIRINLI
jgi:hypothetical protein